MFQNLEVNVNGCAIKVHVSILLIPAAYALTLLQGNQPLWILASFIVVLVSSVLLHEAGHAIVMWTVNTRCEEIMLHGLGGYAHPNQQDWDSRLSALDKFLIAIGGALLGFAVGYLAYKAIPFATDMVTLVIVTQIAVVNTVLNVGNLLPVPPFDGGLALEALISMVTPEDWRVYVRWTLHSLGLVVGAVGVVLGIWSGSVFIGMVGLVLAVLNVHTLFTMLPDD